MRDSEVVASIMAGDPEGLAEAYDKYSGPLFGYCRSLLREPDDAADAVQDTFVIAASHVTRLRDPERLRAWLFAVARNECLHRLKSRRSTAPLQDVLEHPDDRVDVVGEAERAESRALMRAAVGGLNDSERDVINQLWHGLDVPEVASVLGVSRNHVHSLFSRARDQLEASVAVLVVGRSGRKDCAVLDRLLHGWDGRLTAALRKRVGRHIDRCTVCSARRREELKPAVLLSVTPGAVLGLATGGAIPALAGSGPAGSGPGGMVTPPPGLRADVLHLATDPGQHTAAYRGAASRSTGPFHLNGFPKSPHTGHLWLARTAHLPLSVAGGTAVAATATVVATAIVPHIHTGRPGGPGGGRPIITPTAAAVSTGPASGRTSGGHRSASPTATAARVQASRVRHGPGRPVPSGAATVPGTSGSPSPTGGTPTGGTPTGGTPTGTPTASGSTTVAPSPTVSVTVSGTMAATLGVSPTSVVLSPLLGGTLTLTANGGPVSWSIAEPASLVGSLTVSPSSGTADPGTPVTVTLTVSGLASLGTTLTVSPGGQVVTVVLGLG